MNAETGRKARRGAAGYSPPDDGKPNEGLR